MRFIEPETYQDYTMCLSQERLNSRRESLLVRPVAVDPLTRLFETSYRILSFISASHSPLLAITFRFGITVTLLQCSSLLRPLHDTVNLLGCH